MPDDGGIQSVTGISPISVDNADPFNPIVSILNSGTALGRAGVPILAGYSVLTNASSWSFSWTANQFRELIIGLRGTGGMSSGFATACGVQFNGDTGNNYNWAYQAVQGNGSQATGSGPVSGVLNKIIVAATASVPSTDICLNLLLNLGIITNVARPLIGTFTSRGSTNNNFIQGQMSGVWTNTGTPITSAVVSFGSPVTGIGLVWGVPT